MEATDGLPLPQRTWAILTIMLGLTMAVLDGAIANVALPTIARDVQASPADSIWVVNAYQLAVTISLLPLSSIGEIYGYRRVYRAGLALFTVASLGCALSHSLTTLTIARVVQGFGAAGIMSVNTALVRFIYPRARLGQAMGLNAMVGSAASALGPTVAAGILSVASWPYLFAVNVPVGVVTLAIAMRSLPQTEHAARRFDTASALLSALTFGLLITGIDGAGHGERAALVAAVLIGAVTAGAILVRRQMAITSPLLPIDLMRIPMFGLSVATSICAFAAQGLAIVSLPFFFENALHRGQVATGLLLTPWPLTVAVVAPIAGRLSDRYPAGLLGGIGLLVLAAGLLGLVLLPPDPSAFEIAWRMTLCGAGFGCFNSPNNRAMIAAAPRSRTGGASGMLSTARLLGQTTGAALVALAFGLAPAHGTGLALSLATTLALVAAAVSCVRLGRRVRPARALGSD
ncbi:MAG TPA: MFS transporter [Acetobacteraceae bacterium]|nr:MFS transporter [Acetobacteraceae bacterium]